MTRVPLIEPGTRPELAELEARISAERGRVSLLYRALLNSAPIASGWERMLTAVRNQCALPAALRELAILRVAVLNKAVYEYEAHVPHAERAGLSTAKIEGARQVPVPDGIYEPLEKLVLDITDAMTRDIEVPDALMNELARHLDDTLKVELVATIAAYNMVSRFLVALKIEH
jgi:AhpD family alkylhydroperoxidase